MLPYLSKIPSTKSILDVFRGYNHNLRIGEGEFFDEENLSSDNFPVMTVRDKRHDVALPITPNGKATGITWTEEGLCYTDGADFVTPTQRIPMGLTEGEKELVNFGAYVLIFPDKKFINMADTEERGDMNVAHFSQKFSVQLWAVNLGSNEPRHIERPNPTPMDPGGTGYWLDTSKLPNELYYRDSADKSWTRLPETYVRFEAPDISKGLDIGDTIHVQGYKPTNATFIDPITKIIDKPGLYKDNCFMVKGTTWGDNEHQYGAGLLVARTIPDGLTHFVEAGNRLWACRHGRYQDYSDSKVRYYNEILCSAQGDFKNWYSFEGTAMDSYRVAVGSEGEWTGGVSFNGTPIFFKENIMHRVMGSIPANFGLQDTECMGVRKGESKSLAILNGTLVYNSVNGLMVYDGSRPVEMGNFWGDREDIKDAVSCTFGSKLYVSCRGIERPDSVLTFDQKTGIWHKEGGLSSIQMIKTNNNVISLDGNGKMVELLSKQSDKSLNWYAETGEIGITDPEMKYVSRMMIRMSMDVGAVLRCYAKYDFTDEWELQFEEKGDRLQSFSIPIRPKRCDFMKLRFEGVGDVRIYSITKTIEQGGEPA